MLEANLVRVAPELLLKMQRRVTRPLRVVLVRDRGAEQRHDPVARVLIDSPLEAMLSFGEDREKAIHDPVPVFGVDRLREIHRTLHVREEDGHLLALAFEGAAGGENLFGEMLRGVGARVGGAGR
jgi:hypothetical protein